MRSHFRLSLLPPVTAHHPPRLDWSLWRWWTLANAGAAMVGLGASAMLIVSLGGVLEDRWGNMAAATGLALGATALEGGIIGLAQWLVLRRPLPRLGGPAWVLATTAGLLVVWSLGLAPITLIALGGPAQLASPSPADWTLYSLAAGLGLVLGPLLAWPQWRVLRRYVRRASWWIPANVLAWTVGMVFICLGGGHGVDSQHLLGLVRLLSTLAATGAGVGGVHGLALVWLLGQKE